MRSTFLGLEVAKRTIQIAQKAQDVTNTNISNINTSGYSRQRVDLNSMYLSVTGQHSTPIAKLTLGGQGVNAYGVSQVRDKYVDKRYREFTAYVSEYDVKSSVLSEIETIISDVDDNGLVANMDDLRTALSKYAADAPTSKELASIVRNEAYSICQTLHSYNTQLNNLLNENLIDLEDSISEVNDIIEQIAFYNGVITGEYNITAADKIYYGESVIGSYGPNELIDQRNALIDELSYYGDINVSENNDGSVKVTMGSSVIIDSTKYENVFMKDYDVYGAAILRFTNGEAVDTSTGDLKARMDLINGNGSYAGYYQSAEYGIPYYISTIDAFAQSLASLMNELNGCTDSDTSRAMFATTDDVYDEDGNCIERGIVTAANIRISDEWMAEAEMIGRNYNEETGEWELSLDSTNVNTLYLGLDKEVSVGRMGEFTGSVYDYLLFIDDRVAESISYYGEQYDLNSDNADYLLDLRESISGVSETEEGVNMLNYQKWFNASSRMLTTLDEMLDRIINSTGTVGL